MGAHHAAIGAALLAALVAGCTSLSLSSLLSAPPPGQVHTGSVAPQVQEDGQEPSSAPTAAPTLAAFEATELTSGLRCTGSYNPLENSPTFAAAVACDDGRMGKVTAARSHGLSGAGTLILNDGTEGTVALRRLASEGIEAPPSAANQLPSPDLSAYVR